MSEHITGRPLVKLPNIDLPKFDGNYERWISFKDLFESLVSNAILFSIQKLHYLKVSLMGEAVKVVASIELTNDNYEVA